MATCQLGIFVLGSHVITQAVVILYIFVSVASKWPGRRACVVFMSDVGCEGHRVCP